MEFMLHGNSNSLTFACRIIKHFCRTVTKKIPTCFGNVTRKYLHFASKCQNKTLIQAAMFQNVNLVLLISILAVYDV